MFENGSTYLKIDSHLHTQSDKEFSFDGPDKTFINDYVEALVNKDIKVGSNFRRNPLEQSSVLSFLLLLGSCNHFSYMSI